MRNLAIAVSLVRLLPHLSVLHFAPNRGTIRVDLARWQDGASGDELSGGALIWAFARTMTLAPEFRNLFYYRLEDCAAQGLAGSRFNIECPAPLPSGP